MTRMKYIFSALIDKAREHRLRIGKVKFVKLLYLLEWLYSQQTKNRLTNLDWRFLHFGPYPMDFESALQEAEINTPQEVLENERSFYDFSKSTISEYHVNSEVQHLINYVVQEWGSMDTNALLDYVYFRTDPMVDAKRGDKLDFSKYYKHLHYPQFNMPKLSKDRKKQLKKSMKNFLKNRGSVDTIRPKGVVDKYLEEAITTMDKIESHFTESDSTDMIINT